MSSRQFGFLQDYLSASDRLEDSLRAVLRYLHRNDTNPVHRYEILGRLYQFSRRSHDPITDALLEEIYSITDTWQAEWMVIIQSTIPFYCGLDPHLTNVCQLMA